MEARAREGHGSRLCGLLIAVGLSGACADAQEEDFEASLAEQGATEASESSAAEEMVGVTQQGLLLASSQSSAELFQWKKGQPDQYLKPVDSHLCYLTRVSGQVGPSSIAVHRSTSDGAARLQWLRSQGLSNLGYIENDSGSTWKLTGYSDAGNSLTAEATCVPLASFYGDTGTVVWVSPRHIAQTSYGSATAELWWANSASFLQGLTGTFNGGGEKADIVTGPTWDSPSYVRISQQVGFELFEAAGQSIYVGVPGASGTFRQTPVSSSGNKKTRLLATSRGICYLTKISGDFNGSEERIRIYPQLDGTTEYWYLETHAGGGSAYATAECMPYDQSYLPYCNTHYCG